MYSHIQEYGSVQWLKNSHGNKPFIEGGMRLAQRLTINLTKSTHIIDLWDGYPLIGISNDQYQSTKPET